MCCNYCISVTGPNCTDHPESKSGDEISSKILITPVSVVMSTVMFYARYCSAAERSESKISESERLLQVSYGLTDIACILISMWAELCSWDKDSGGTSFLARVGSVSNQVICLCSRPLSPQDN